MMMAAIQGKQIGGWWTWRIGTMCAHDHKTGQAAAMKQTLPSIEDSDACWKE